MFFKKLISGDNKNRRKTRFHDERGGKIDLKYYPNLIRSIKSNLQKRITSTPPSYPWLPYSATNFILRYFKEIKGKNILEFGAGYSTIFFSENLANIYSKEDNSDWFKFLKNKIVSKKICNPKLEFAEDKGHYLKISKDWPDKYDLILVDGSWRDECLPIAFEKTKKNSLIVLDNSDKFALNDYYKYPEDLTGNVFKAREELKKYAENKRLTIKQFVDFSPCNLYVHECMLVICQE